MLLAWAQLIVGFIALTWTADRFVTGSAALADKLNIPPLLIGLTVVALGTSAPEIVVAITSVLHGNPGIGIGNAIGSNIANIGLVVGLTALITPLTLQSKTLMREFPILGLIMVSTYYILHDLRLTTTEAYYLFLMLASLIGWMIYTGLKHAEDIMASEFKEETPHLPNLKIGIALLIGLIGLPLSAEILVSAAIHIASGYGVSEWVIGLSIVAIGTSLPEIATSLAGALKNEHDIAVGNILGSNMFNLVAVLPFSGILGTTDVNADILSRDLPVMFGITLLLFILSIRWKQPGKVSRTSGGILLLGYGTYLYWLLAHSLT